MTTTNEFDRVLDEWFAGAAADAMHTMPEGLHHAAMERVRRSPQHRSWSATFRTAAAGRDSAPAFRLAYLALIIGLLGVVSLFGFILAFGGGPGLVPVPVPSSSASPTSAPSAPSAEPAPSAQPASSPALSPGPSLLPTAGFVRPFDYSIPAGSDLQLFHGGCPRFECDFYVGPDHDAITDTDYAHPRESDLRGVTLVRVSPSFMVGCSVVPGIQGRRPPDQFLADLQTAAGTTLGPITPTTVDGRPALSSTLEPAACSFHLRAAASPNSSDSIGFDVPSRLIVLDVDGETLMIDIWARTADKLDEWLPTATQFVDSIRFVQANASSASPAPSNQATPSASTGPTAQPLPVNLQFGYTIPSDTALHFRGHGWHAFVFAEAPRGDGTLPYPYRYPMIQSGDRRGVIITSLELAWVDACGIDTERRWVRNTPAEFLDDLRTIAGFALGDIASPALDGRPALSARMDPAGSTCQDNLNLHVADPITGLAGQGLPLAFPSRLTVADVNRVPVLVEVWARSEDGLDAWLPIAQEFLDSIRFTAAD